MIRSLEAGFFAFAAFPEKEIKMAKKQKKPDCEPRRLTNREMMDQQLRKIEAALEANGWKKRTSSAPLLGVRVILVPFPRSKTKATPPPGETAEEEAERLARDASKLSLILMTRAHLEIGCSRARDDWSEESRRMWATYYKMVKEYEEE